MGITEIFDRYSTNTITYLGFPICHTHAQQLQIEHRLHSTFDCVIQPHSTRSLSVRGRATVVNTLALSKLWHGLRLLHLSSTFFDQLQKKIRDFVSAGRKIQRIAWDRMIRPINEGGLGIIDPRAQHQALHLRWASRALSTSFATSTTVSSLQLAVTWLKHSISASMSRPLPSFSTASNLAIANPDLSIFSPVRRAQLQNSVHQFSVVRPIFQCISNLPDVRSHPLLVLTPAAVLEMPLNDIWYSHSNLCSITPKSYKRILVKHCYAYDLTSHRLIPRLNRADPLNIHPLLSRRLHMALIASEAFLYPFCLNLVSLPTTPLSRPLGSITYSPLIQIANTLQIHRITAHTYRQALLLATPTTYSSVSWITKRQWHKFWSVTLSFSCKNLWYRLLHDKITTRSVMFHARPDKTPSPNCPLCPDAAYHTAEHMLVRCPRVWQIWKTTFLYICPTDRNITCLSPRQLITALYSLRTPSSTLSPLHVTYLFGSILESIWRHYWLYTIDEVPFVPLTVAVSAIKLFRQYTPSSFIGPMPLLTG